MWAKDRGCLRLIVNDYAAFRPIPIIEESTLGTH